MNESTTQRARLSAIIFYETSQNIRKCMTCGHCEESIQPEMDLSFRELLDSARRDDVACLQSKTLWNCDRVLEEGYICASGLDIGAIVQVLRREAVYRGLDPGSSE